MDTDTTGFNITTYKLLPVFDTQIILQYLYFKPLVP